MHPVLKQILDQGSAGPKALEEAVNRNRAKLTPQIGVEARQLFTDALARREGQTAMLASVAASLIYDKLGDQFNALKNRIDYVQLEFIQAQTVEEYRRVRELCRALMEQARRLPAPDLEFQAAVQAADSAYFAWKASTNDVKWLISALEDLVVACERYAGENKGGQLAKLSSLLAATVDQSMSRLFADEQQKQIDSLLRVIASLVENVIPADFKFPNDAVKTSQIATAITTLVDRYGS